MTKPPSLLGITHTHPIEDGPAADDGRTKAFSVDLDGEYGIDADDYNFTLVSRRTQASGKGAGQEIRSPVGYYGRLHLALDAYTKKALGTANVRTVEDIRREVSRLEASVLKAGKAFMAKFPPPQAAGDEKPDVVKSKRK